MATRSKFFFWLLLVIIVFVSGYKFKQFFLDKDFTLLVNLNCNPASESCFVMDCSPADDLECDDTPYKKLETWAGNAPECLLQRTCLDFSCPTGDASCRVAYCSEDALEMGEKCMQPEILETIEEKPVAHEEASNISDE